MSKLALPDAQTAVITSQALHSLPSQYSRPPPPPQLEGLARLSHGVSGAGGAVSAYSDSWMRISPFFGHSALPFQTDLAPLRDFLGGGPLFESSVGQLADMQYLNILPSMGQAIYIMNSEDELIYWNRTAEKLYGYTAAEVLGKTVLEILVEDENVALGCTIASRVKSGESWTGLFPVRDSEAR